MTCLRFVNDSSYSAVLKKVLTSFYIMLSITILKPFL